MPEDSQLKNQLRSLLINLIDYDYNKITETNDPGMFNGYAGLSLFYYHAYLHFNNTKYYKKSIDYFQKGFNSKNLKGFNLSHGATGIMWLLNYFKKEKAFILNFEKQLTTYDNLLLKKIDEYTDDLDPMHGLLSIGNYLLLRKTTIAKKSLIKILNRIDLNKIETNIGITWENSKDDSEKGTLKHINFGYAHGILCILYFVSKLATNGIESKKCQELFEKGICYFLSFMNMSYKTYFPNRIQQNKILRNNRVAYCYGDLGIACGLTVIGQDRKDTKLLKIAKQVALNIAIVSIKHIDDIDDIGLCHGAAGNGYLFYKLYKAYGVDILQEACIVQYQKLLSLKEEGFGIGGLRSIDFDVIKKQFYKKNDSGFITGTSGVGLSIITYLRQEKEIDWDKILYLS